MFLDLVEVNLDFSVPLSYRWGEDSATTIEGNVPLMSALTSDAMDIRFGDSRLLAAGLFHCSLFIPGRFTGVRSWQGGKQGRA